jgi:hypothetical protein
MSQDGGSGIPMEWYSIQMWGKHLAPAEYKIAIPYREFTSSTVDRDEVPLASARDARGSK